jgi:hypothetical protein
VNADEATGNCDRDCGCDGDCDAMKLIVGLGAIVDGQILPVDSSTWAIHGFIAYGGEVLLAEFDTLDHAQLVLDRTPRVDRAPRSTRG